MKQQLSPKHKQFLPKEIKSRTPHVCKRCGGDILVGTRYVSVMYNDGFNKRAYGAFCVGCWEEFLIE